MTRLFGSEPGALELKSLTINKVIVGREGATTNSYVLRCKETGAQLIVDAANDAARLLDLCGGRVDAVVTTHLHWDHWEYGLADVVAATGARTYAGAPDVDGIAVHTDVPVDDGDVIRFGEIELRAIRLTGHTPGGIALLYDDPTGHPHLFSGDSLFPGGVGNTFGDPEAFQTLFGDVVSKLFDRLPDETVVYPGHGADTTLGTERPSLPEWQARGW